MIRTAISRGGDLAAYALLRVVICLIQLVPLERCQRWCSLLAIFLQRGIRLRGDLVRENLHRVFPEWPDWRIESTTNAMWQHLLMMVCEIAQAPRKIHRTNWYDHFTFSDRRKILQVIVDTRPKIFVTGHFGNFEMAGFINGLFGISSTALARPLDNPYIHRYLTDFRSLGGQHFLSKDGSASEIQRLLDAGELLGLLADQDAGNRGCWVRFLGHPASCHKALALFTLSSEAPMLVCYNRRMKHPLHFELVVTGVADPATGGPHLDNVQSLTQWYNDCLEGPIRQYPEQYWWLHRRWRDPPKRLKRASERAAQAEVRVASLEGVQEDSVSNESADHERAA